MKIINKLSLGFLLALACFSCQQEELIENESREVRIQSGIVTKASGTDWHLNDKIGVYLQAGTNLTENVPYTNSSPTGLTADFTSDFPLYLPSKGTSDLYAYYPYEESVANGIYDVDVTEQTSLPEIDLMTAHLSDVTAGTGVLSMNFSHRLSLININIDSDETFTEEDIDAMSVTLDGLHAQATYGINSGSIDFASDASTDVITLARVKNRLIEAIVVPQSFEGATLTFTIAGKAHTAALTTEVFEGGKVYTYNASFSGGKLENFSSNMVNDWVPSIDDDYILVNIENNTSATNGEVPSNIVLAAYSASGEQIATNINATPYKNELYRLDARLSEIDKIYFFGGLDSDNLGDIEGVSEADLRAKIISAESPVDLTKFYQNVVSSSNLQGSIININPAIGLAKLNVMLNTAKSVELESFKLTGLVGSTAIVAGEAHESSTAMGYEIFDLAELDREIYLFEDADASVMATIKLSLDGVKHVLYAKLPQNIERNKHYTITINSDGASLSTDVKVLPWGDAVDMEVLPDTAEATIDKAASELPAGTSVTDNTINISASFEGQVKIVIDVDMDIDLNVQTEEFTITRAPSELLNNTFLIDFKKVDISKPKTLTQIFIKGPNGEIFSNSHITVIRETYRMEVTNFKGISDGPDLSYSDYADGTLFVMSPRHEVAKISSESDDDQFNWIRVDENTDGTYNIEGGFKPNDLEAIGQDQSATLTVTYSDGVEEIYNIKRKRKSLPVVYLAGRYWMQFNLKGNPKKYEDQFNFEEAEIFTSSYLETATDEQFEYYAGNAYKGIDHRPLTLGVVNGVLQYTDMADKVPTDTHVKPSDYMTPAGFTVPTEAEFALILRNKAVHLPAAGSSSVYNFGSYSLNVGRYRRDLTLRELSTFSNYLTFQETDGGDILIINGLGWQDDRSYQPEYLIHTLYGNRHSTINFTRGYWDMYAATEKGAKYIRAIKTPAVYVIE